MRWVLIRSSTIIFQSKTDLMKYSFGIIFEVTIYIEIYALTHQNGVCNRRVFNVEFKVDSGVAFYSTLCQCCIVIVEFILRFETVLADDNRFCRSATYMI